MREMLLIVAFDTQTDLSESVAVWEYSESRFQQLALDNGSWKDMGVPGLSPEAEMTREEFTALFGRKALAPGTKKVLRATLTWEWQED
jgi:hypothetical protein